MKYISISPEEHKNLCRLFDVECEQIDFDLVELCGVSQSAFKGLNHTENSKEKIRQSNLGEKNPMFGIRGEKHHLYGTKSLKPMLNRKGESHPMFGHKMSADSKEKIRQANLGEKNPMFGKKHPILTCPHCKKSGSKNGMVRWHFNNCRLNILT
jgi:hypothetical protein